MFYGGVCGGGEGFVAGDALTFEILLFPKVGKVAGMDKVGMNLEE
jgi:hypothetical protein